MLLSSSRATTPRRRRACSPPGRIPGSKARWFIGPDDWRKSDHALDFRVGGRESVSGGPPGGPVHRYDAVYHDIVPDERIILCYDMHLDDRRISVSLAMIEFKPAGELKPAGRGTTLIYTEQGVFLDGYDDPAGREHGTRALLDKLEADLQRTASN